MKYYWPGLFVFTMLTGALFQAGMTSLAWASGAFATFWLLAYPLWAGMEEDKADFRAGKPSQDEE